MYPKQLTFQEIERLDGLVNMELLASIRTLSNQVIIDLQKDGFDRKDIATYLWFNIETNRVPPGHEPKPVTMMQDAHDTSCEYCDKDGVIRVNTEDGDGEVWVCLDHTGD